MFFLDENSITSRLQISLQHMKLSDRVIHMILRKRTAKERDRSKFKTEPELQSSQESMNTDKIEVERQNSV
jgi:hypothetical protein